jgi:hypothetical protein
MALPPDALQIEHQRRWKSKNLSRHGNSCDVGVVGSEWGRAQSMLSALGELLPIAVAAAVSSVPIMATILILLSPKRSHPAIPFLVGWVLGMAAVVVVATVGASAPH